jgi:hypothetical protein
MEETLASPSENIKAPEAKATPEVQDAITKIEATQASIAEHTGATGQELTDSTDKFLVDHAEHAVGSDIPDKADIVETALVEGALEATGERPVATENPIITLEKDGYDQQVTEGVKKLHEEGATLPDGESAAEVVVATLEAQEAHQEQSAAPFNTESLKGRTESIGEVVEHARQSGAKVAEIPVWGAESVPVNAGEVGVIATEGLNGCHTTILAGKNEQGESVVAMTHFPPELGSQRYVEAVHEHKDTFEQQGVALDTIFTFVDKTRFPKETEMLTTEFPEATFHSAEYDSRDPNEKGQDYGKCVAVLDNSGEQAVLTILTDRGDEQIAIGSGESRADISEQLDNAIQYYVNGASKEDILEHTGLDPSALTKHIRGLPTEEADYLKDMRRKSLDSSPGHSQEASTPETSQLSRTELETAFLYGVQEDSSMTQEQLDAWYKTLPGDEQKRLAEGKQEISQYAEHVKQAEITVEHNLETTAPELLEGRLPKELADRIGSEYAIGLRQLGSYEAEDAQEELDDDGGVDVSNLGLVQSFNVIKKNDDDLTTKGIVIKGYYGAHAGGKFVIAVPMAEGITDPTQAYDSIPDMQRGLESSDNSDFSAVNPKYVAGFIDGEGIFHPNENFMQSSEPKLTNKPPSAQPQAEVAKPEEATNHYERLTAEQLAKVRDNIADSIVQGIRKYDLDEVARASANLAAIQREIEARSPEAQPAHQRGEVDGATTYITEPDRAVIQKIVVELQKIDGASDIARAMYGGLETPQPNASDIETRLQAMEMQSLLANISREIRYITGSEFGSSTNPYASIKNEELAKTVDQLKQTIQERTTQGLDTADFKSRLALVGQVIQSRQ